MDSFLSPEQENVALSLYNSGSSWEKCASGAKIFQTIKKGQWNSNPVVASLFQVRVEKDLPSLAWICEINKDAYDFLAGPGVEAGNDFIVEGAWDGDFAAADFLNSDHFYGSGAKLDENGTVVFAPPRLCTDYLFVLHDKTRQKTWVSNSFNFIFTRADIKPESGFFKNFAENINSSTNSESALGADRGSPLIAEDKSFVMYRMMYHNFTIGLNGGINYTMRMPGKLQIKNFNAYKLFLLDKVNAILKNGGDSGRKRPYGAVTMLSTGYDSCATSSVCAQCGVRDAVTFDVIVGGHNDCGAEIADALGLNCHKVRSPLGKNVSVLRAVVDRNSDLLEFVATAGIGDNAVFKSMEPFFKGNLVFSGLYGDGCWSRGEIEAGLAHHLPYMKSRMEFRLRTGCCLIPVPAFGSYFPYFLNRINSDDEMRPWTLGNSYDRPIPRRLAEEAGVPRELFGMRKCANNPDIVNYKDLFVDAVRFTMERYRKG